MKANCFGPTVARIDADDELTFRNVDEHAHTVGGVAGTFGDPTRRFPRVKAYLLALTLGIVATTVVLRRRQKALDTA